MQGQHRQEVCCLLILHASHPSKGLSSDAKEGRRRRGGNDRLRRNDEGAEGILGEVRRGEARVD